MLQVTSLLLNASSDFIVAGNHQLRNGELTCFSTRYLVQRQVRSRVRKSFICFHYTVQRLHK